MVDLNNYDPEILEKIKDTGDGGYSLSELSRNLDSGLVRLGKVISDMIDSMSIGIEQGGRERPSKDEYYICIAKAVSKRSTCLKRQYGAVIVNNDEIIATGYNGNPRGVPNCIDCGYCNRIDKPHNSGDYSDCYSVHAEQNAMLSAARRDMIGATLYLYGSENGEDIQNPSPCPICERMIANAGIKRIVS